MYEQLLQLDTLNISFNEAGMRLLNVFMAVVMYGVALGVRPQMFRNVFNHPGPLVRGIFSQLIVLPIMTFLLVMLCHNILSPMVAMGMILVAACPGGNVSNFMTSHAEGNSELSITMSSITTLAAPIFTPLNFALWGGLYVKYMNRSAQTALRILEIPAWQMLLTVLFIIIIPLALGLLTQKFFPRFAKAMKPFMRYISIAIFLIIAGMMFMGNLELFTKYIGYIFIIVLVHNLLAFGIGFITGSLGSTAVRDRRALTLEVGIQNSGLGLILLFNPAIFPQDLANGGMVFVAAWWGVWHIIAGLILSTCFRLTKFDTADLTRNRKRNR